MVIRMTECGRNECVALAAAALQRALAQLRLAGEVVRWAYPSDADHGRTARASRGTGRGRKDTQDSSHN